MERDFQLAGDLDQERSVMDNIYHKLKEDNHPLKKWYYGHFHLSHLEVIDDIKFTALDIMELKELY